MANPTTAAEWKAVAAQYETQNEELLRQIRAAEAQLAEIDVQLAEVERKRKGLTSTPGGLTGREFDALNAELTAQRRELISRRNPIQRARNDLVRQFNENNRLITRAYSEAQMAEEGEPGTSTNTPPATNQPGSGTTVPPATTPLQTTSTPAEVTPAQIPTTTPVQGISTAAAVTPTQIPTTTPVQAISTAAAVTPTQIPTTTPVQGISTTPQPIQQFSNRPPEDSIPITQRTVDDDPTATINAQIEDSIPRTQRTVDNDPTATIQAQNNNNTIIPPSQIATNPSATGSSTGSRGAVQRTRAQATSQDNNYLSRLPDWRVRLQLAEGATYLYKSQDSPGILGPLQDTNGVIFPYTPNIQVQYGAHYDPVDITHSNYKVFQYKNSSVDNISITADFTAQDTYEARYLLAVIHFFRSVTKMFYGNDLNPKNGTPPPLCYLSGLGEFNFNQHPLAVTNFTYTLPTDVDYIRATTEANSPPGVNQSAANVRNNTGNPTVERTSSSGLQPGGITAPPNFRTNYVTGARDPTYVPTKMQIIISAVPIMSRNVISTKFSLKDYASGKLLRGSSQPLVKGVW
jgi:hypothetical protein